MSVELICTAKDCHIWYCIFISREGENLKIDNGGDSVRNWTWEIPNTSKVCIHIISKRLCILFTLWLWCGDRWSVVVRGVVQERSWWPLLVPVVHTVPSTTTSASTRESWGRWVMFHLLFLHVILFYCWLAYNIPCSIIFVHPYDFLHYLQGTV